MLEEALRAIELEENERDRTMKEKAHTGAFSGQEKKGINPSLAQIYTLSRSIHEKYVALAKQYPEELEPLKRAIYMQWISVSTRCDLVGIHSLNERVWTEAIELLDRNIFLGRVDDEFLSMLGIYHAITDWFANEPSSHNKYLRMLFEEFDRRKKEDRVSDRTIPEHYAGHDYSRRGQMGEYFLSHRFSEMPLAAYIAVRERIAAEVRKKAVGDRVEITGGYYYTPLPLYLMNPPASKRTGTIIKFIKGENDPECVIVKLDGKISGKKVTGDIVVLSLRYVDATWSGEEQNVHVNLFDFMPESEKREEWKRGEWVESHATLRAERPHESSVAVIEWPHYWRAIEFLRNLFRPTKKKGQSS